MKICCKHVQKDVANMLIALLMFVVFLKSLEQQRHTNQAFSCFISRPVLSRTAACFELASGGDTLHETSVSFVG